MVITNRPPSILELSCSQSKWKCFSDFNLQIVFFSTHRKPFSQPSRKVFTPIPKLWCSNSYKNTYYFQVNFHVKILLWTCRIQFWNPGEKFLLRFRKFFSHGRKILICLYLFTKIFPPSRPSGHVECNFDNSGEYLIPKSEFSRLIFRRCFAQSQKGFSKLQFFPQNVHLYTRNALTTTVQETCRWKSIFCSKCQNTKDYMQKTSLSKRFSSQKNAVMKISRQICIPKYDVLFARNITKNKYKYRFVSQKIHLTRRIKSWQRCSKLFDHLPIIVTQRPKNWWTFSVIFSIKMSLLIRRKQFWQTCQKLQAQDPEKNVLSFVSILFFCTQRMQYSHLCRKEFALRTVYRFASLRVNIKVFEQNFCNSSSRRVSRSDGGGGLKTRCIKSIKMSYSKPSGTEGYWVICL